MATNQDSDSIVQVGSHLAEQAESSTPPATKRDSDSVVQVGSHLAEQAESSTPPATNQDSDSVVEVGSHVAEQAEPSIPPADAVTDLTQHSKSGQLHLAAYKGDWETARPFLDDPTEIIATNEMNALHVASLYGHTEFVVKLVQHKHMSVDGVSTQRTGGFTALHHAVFGGNLEMAKALIGKNPQLIRIRDSQGNTPLLTAVLCFDYEMVDYLVQEMAKDEVLSLPPSKVGDLMVNLTHLGYHDISLHLIHGQPSLALTESEEKETILQVLAYEPAHFRSGTKLNFWQNWIYEYIPVHDQDFLPKNISLINEVHQGIKGVFWSTARNLVPCIRKIWKKKLGHERACKLVDDCLEALLDKEAQEIEEYFNNQKILYFAACHGVMEVVIRSLNKFPDLIFSDHGIYLLKNAIEWRQENVYNFACQNTAVGKMLAGICNVPSISHLAAKLPANPKLWDNSSAVLQMQREAQWYKEIGRIEHPRMRQLQSRNGDTAFTAFSKRHRNMRVNAEKWMKDTSNSTMLVSTLIATVAFAAAFTLPGGTNETGAPIFLRDTWFILFACSDALALFSSITSILMFLSILTSSYHVDDFRIALPRRMILGLATLFLSLATIMVAFGAGLNVVLRNRFSWAWGPILIMAAFPVTLFIRLQLPLFMNLVASTYGTIFTRN